MEGARSPLGGQTRQLADSSLRVAFQALTGAMMCLQLEIIRRDAKERQGFHELSSAALPLHRNRQGGLPGGSAAASTRQDYLRSHGRRRHPLRCVRLSPPLAAQHPLTPGVSWMHQLLR